MMTRQNRDDIKISHKLMDNIDEMRDMLGNIFLDLFKVSLGNKTASQRVRNNTVKFDKISKEFRRISANELKKGRVK